MFRKLLGIFILGGITVFAVAYARGYRINFVEKNVSPTGIMLLESSPKDARVFINDKLYGYTDLRTNLKPNIYQVTVDKLGYFPWRKTVTVQGEVVYGFYPTLFSKNPTLYPLTNIKIARAIPIGMPTEKILCIDEGGLLYLYNQNKRIIRLNDSITPVIGNEVAAQFDFTNSTYYFSPDRKNALVLLPKKNLLEGQRAIMLDLEQVDSYTMVDDYYVTLLDAWTQTQKEENDAILAVFPEDLLAVATRSAEIVSFSADKSKVIYRATQSATIRKSKKNILGSNQQPETRAIVDGYYYLYDRNEFRNYFISDKTTPIIHPNSKNIVFFKKETINIADFDGSNEQIVYSGSYQEDFFALTTEGKLLLLTNLNSKTTTHYTLYHVSF